MLILEGIVALAIAQGQAKALEMLGNSWFGKQLGQARLEQWLKQQLKARDAGEAITPDGQRMPIHGETPQRQQPMRMQGESGERSMTREQWRAQQRSRRLDHQRNQAHNAANAAKLNQSLRATESANPVIESLRNTGNLPSNYVTKSQAVSTGWQPGKALNNSVPGGQIGGDVFRNSNSVVPSARGRIWYEADIGLNNTMSRSKQAGTRLLYSNDGLLYVTPDHYQTAHPIGRWK